MNHFNCEDVDTRLQDFVDDRLTAAEEHRMREHLAECASCRREERALRRLLARVAELPRELAPPRDLWAGVAARLGERPDEGEDEPQRIAAPRKRFTPRPWAWRAAAALGFMALGAVLAQLFAADLPPANELAERAPAGDVRAAAASSAEFTGLEFEYLRAKDSLWLMVYSRHEDLSPATVEVVQRNLRIIDEAIRELHEALAENPGNRRLEGLLLANHRRGIDLLRRLAEPAVG